MIMITE